MGENTKIEWATHTFNPWVGCAKVSPGCDHCYAEGWAKRSGSVQWGPHAERRRTTAANWRQPMKWNREAEASGTRPRIFCASLADVFDNAVPVEWRADLFALIRETPYLDWLLVTKRIGNVRAMLPADWGSGYPNVWLLITVTDQIEVDRDIPKLLRVQAAVRGLSVEPMLGSIDLSLCFDLYQYEDGDVWRSRNMSRPLHSPDWVIIGGESGPNARPMHPQWARELRDQCVAADVPFLFKQWGEWLPMDQQERSREFNGIVADRANGAPVGGYPAERVHQWDGAMESYRAGKKNAGRLLDGVQHDGYPGARP
jgi:protein gp37